MKRVLIVDDEGDLNESLGMLLELRFEDLQVDMAPSTQEGATLLSRHTYDLVISDYLMPGPDGLAFLAHVGRRYPGVPRILITAYPGEGRILRALEELRVDAFLPKPFDIDATLQVVSKALRQPPRLPGTLEAAPHRAALGIRPVRDAPRREQGMRGEAGAFDTL